MIKASEFSSCNNYRYTLTRIWNEGGKNNLPVIGLNPSAADEQTDDPTIRRCIRFASNGGWDGIIMLNLFALISTDPKLLKTHRDPIGPENDNYLQDVLGRYQQAWVCWGSSSRPESRERIVLEMIRTHICVGVTNAGHPKHPLYVPYSADFRPF